MLPLRVWAPCWHKAVPCERCLPETGENDAVFVPHVTEKTWEMKNLETCLPKVSSKLQENFCFLCDFIFAVQMDHRNLTLIKHFTVFIVTFGLFYAFQNPFSTKK